VKRLFDITVAFVALLLLSPVVAIVALLVRWDLGPGVFFRQRRIGWKGREFDLVKFRTMREAVDASGKRLSDAKRLTRIGRFLRSTSLDEIPQLWNVLKGDMALVGPRPLDAANRKLYTEESFHRHDVMPGVTGWAQIHGRNSIGWDERIAFDLWYVQNRSIWLDIKILAKTFLLVVARRGVEVDGGGIAVPAKPAREAGKFSSAARAKPVSWILRARIVAFHVCVDAAILVAALYVAYQLRLDFRFHGTKESAAFWRHAAEMVPLALLSFAGWGAYRIPWRYFGLFDVPRQTAGLATATAMLCIWRRLQLSGQPIAVSYAVIILTLVLGFWGMLAVRFLRRIVREHIDARDPRKRHPDIGEATGIPNRRRAILLGIGRGSLRFARETTATRQVAGFLTLKEEEQGLAMGGFNVLGTAEEWSSVCFREKAEELLAVIPRPNSRLQRERLIRLSELLKTDMPEVQEIRKILRELLDA
jgi:lipopolysaccharide/colanic/teichoic acid biosynthesis glycosyltransferase